MNPIVLAAYGVFHDIALNRDKLASYAGAMDKYAEDDPDTLTDRVGDYLYKNAEQIRDELEEMVQPYLQGFTDMYKSAQHNASYSAYDAYPYEAIAGKSIGGGFQPKPVDKRVMGDFTDLMSKVVGNKWALPATIGAYLLPGTGTVAAGYDALSDLANIFSKDLKFSQRLGYGLSGLLNTGIAAASLIPGLGLVGKGLKSGGKALLGLGRLAESAPRVAGALSRGGKALRGAGLATRGQYDKLVKAMMRSNSPLLAPVKYLTGSGATNIQRRLRNTPGLRQALTPHLWGRTPRSLNVWQHGLADTLGQAGLGTRALSTFGGIGLSPMTALAGGFGVTGALMSPDEKQIQQQQQQAAINRALSNFYLNS